MTIANQLRAHEGFITPKQVAATLNMHYMTIYGYCQTGSLPHIRIGSRLKLDPSAVAIWLEQRRVG